MSDAEEWASVLRLFLIDERADAAEVPDRRAFSPVEEKQCQISGGALLKFIRFLADPKTRAGFSATGEVSGKTKRLVVISDEPGAVAAHDILRMFRPTAIWLLRREWRRWLETGRDLDPEHKRHIEYWSWWEDSRAGQDWESKLQPDTTYFVHYEGYRLAAGTDSGARHLWVWDGQELALQESGVARSLSE